MKKRMLIIGLVVLFVAILFLNLSYNLPYIASSKQQAAFKTETAALEDAVNDLMQTTPSAVKRYCDTYDQGHWHSKAYCHTHNVYDYQQAAQSGGRAATIKRAKALEAILKQRGWTNDRPQDPNQTIEATLPTKDMPTFYSRSIPMHKNIGNVSCNLVISAGGSVNAPVLNVDNYGCRQHVTYYFPHLTRRYHFIV